jgi:hypothetical protein
MRFRVASGIACAAGESLTTTDTVVSERPRWLARVRRVTLSFLSEAFLPVKSQFQGIFKKSLKECRISTLDLSKEERFSGFLLSKILASCTSFSRDKNALDRPFMTAVHSLSVELQKRFFSLKKRFCAD